MEKWLNCGTPSKQSCILVKHVFDRDGSIDICYVFLGPTMHYSTVSLWGTSTTVLPVHGTA